MVDAGIIKIPDSPRDLPSVVPISPPPTSISAAKPSVVNGIFSSSPVKSFLPCRPPKPLLPTITSKITSIHLSDTFIRPSYAGTDFEFHSLPKFVRFKNKCLHFKSLPLPSHSLVLPTPCLLSYSYYSPIAFDTDSDSDSDSDSNDFYSKSNLNSAMPSNLMSCTSLLIPTLESDLDFNLPNLHSRLDKLDRLIDIIIERSQNFQKAFTDDPNFYPPR
jgi:hypothetical protein